MQKLYFLRHGETKINVEGGRFQGQIDTPEAALTENGREQAREARREFARRGFSFDLVYSSPLSRAVQTAVLATGLPESEIIRDDRLLEINFGPLEGKPWEQMEPAKFRALMRNFDQYFPGPGMESSVQLINRVSGFLEEIRQKQPAESILVSTHGGTVRAMLAHLHQIDVRKFWKIPVGNCAWYELTLQDGAWVLTDQDAKPDRDSDAGAEGV